MRGMSALTDAVGQGKIRQFGQIKEQSTAIAHELLMLVARQFLLKKAAPLDEGDVHFPFEWSDFQFGLDELEGSGRESGPLLC